MKKLILLLVVGVYSLMGNSLNKTLFKNISENLLKKSSSVLTRSIKQINTSKYIDNLLKTSKITKLVKPVDKIAVVATLIAQKGGIAKTMTMKYPVKMVNYYAKYGDEFIKVTNNLLPKLPTIKIPNNLITKYNINNLNILKNKDLLAKRFLDVMKWSGKKGWEISKTLFKLTKDHTLGVAAGIAAAWFLADPDGFQEALEKVGDNVVEFVTMIAKTIGNTAVKAVNGSIDAILSSLSNLITTQNVLFLFGLFGLVILWKMRKVISKFIDVKIQKQEEKLDKEIKNRSRYE